MMPHVLKTDPRMWVMVRRGLKHFEIRSTQDRVFQTDDPVWLLPWDRRLNRPPRELAAFHGAECKAVEIIAATVGVVVTGFGLPSDLCVFELRNVQPDTSFRQWEEIEHAFRCSL